MARGKEQRALTVTYGLGTIWVTVIERTWPHWPSEPSVSSILYRHGLDIDSAPWDVLAHLEKVARAYLVQ